MICFSWQNSTSWIRVDKVFLVRVFYTQRKPFPSSQPQQRHIKYSFSLKVYMTVFFICSIKSPQCTDMYSKEKFSIAIFLLRVLMYQKRQISLPGGVQNRETKNRRLGMIVTSFQDFKLLEKHISQSFSYCELINSLRNGTIVRYLENKKMLEGGGGICFSRSPEMTSQSFPVSYFWSRGFVPHRK